MKTNITQLEQGAVGRWGECGDGTQHNTPVHNSTSNPIYIYDFLQNLIKNTKIGERNHKLWEAFYVGDDNHKMLEYYLGLYFKLHTHYFIIYKNIRFLMSTETYSIWSITRINEKNVIKSTKFCNVLSILMKKVYEIQH